MGHPAGFELTGATIRELFRAGSYIPLQANRGKEEHVVAFARVRPGEAAIVAAPRLSYTLMKGNDGTAPGCGLE